MAHFKDRLGPILFQVWLCALLLVPVYGFGADQAFVHKETLREDLEFALGKKVDSANVNPDSSVHRSDNEVKIVLLGMIWVYQVFLSSQDGDHCGFTPTCSHFGQQAIKKYGFLEGTLMTSDRLQRCNGLTWDLYPIDPVTDHAIDPVSVNALWH